MNVFRKVLEIACSNEALRDGDRIYFGPANQFVPIAWVEKMAEFEWECQETGCCSHHSANRFGCYCGQWVNEQWICESLLLDGSMLAKPISDIVASLLSSDTDGLALLP